MTATLTRAARDRRPRTLLRAFAPVLLGAVALALWESVARSGAVPALFLPAPSEVAVRLGEDAGGLLWSYTWPTALRAVAGCLAGAALALPLGYLVYRSRTAAVALGPYIAASQALPAVALAPLLVLWLNRGSLPIVVLCALMVFFPILMTWVLGLRGLDPDVLDAARLDGASGAAFLLRVEIPLALPALLTGLRTGFTLSITGAVVGEFVMGGRGLGSLIAARSRSGDTEGLFTVLVVLCLLATAVYIVLGAAERRSRHYLGENS